MFAAVGSAAVRIDGKLGEHPSFVWRRKDEIAGVGVGGRRRHGEPVHSTHARSSTLHRSMVWFPPMGRMHAAHRSRGAHADKPALSRSRILEASGIPRAVTSRGARKPLTLNLLAGR